MDNAAKLNEEMKVNPILNESEETETKKDHKEQVKITDESNKEKPDITENPSNSEENSDENYLTPEETAELNRKKEVLTKAAEFNKGMLEEVEGRIEMLKNYMTILEESRDDINRVEYKIGKLAQKFNEANPRTQNNAETNT